MPVAVKFGAVTLVAVMLVAGCGVRTVGRGNADPASQADARSPAGPAQAVVKVPLSPCPASTPATGGERLPQLRLDCLGAGPAVDMGAAHGTPTVVNLWASWCVPCRKEMPRLRASAARLGPPVGFLGVDIKDDPGGAWAFLAEMKVRYPNVADPDGAMLAGLRVPGVPVTFVLDPTGAVVYRHIGELHDSDIVEMEAAARAAE